MKSAILLITLVLLSACGVATESNVDSCIPLVSGTKFLVFEPIKPPGCSEPIFKVFQVTDGSLVVPNSGCSVETETSPEVCQESISVRCSVNGKAYELWGEFDDTGSQYVQYTVSSAQMSCEDEYHVTW